MERSEPCCKGDEKRREMYGEAACRRANGTVYADPVMRRFLDVASGTVFEASWTRPGLDTRTRELMRVVSDVATQREDDLEIHLRLVLNQGWTEDELIGTAPHLAGYIGVPSVRGAMQVASRAFAEVRAGTG